MQIDTAHTTVHVEDGSIEVLEAPPGRRMLATGRLDAPAYGLDYNLGPYRAEVISAIEAGQPGCWLIQDWAVTGRSERWFPSSDLAREEMLRIAAREGVSVSGVDVSTVTDLDCTFPGACQSSSMRLAPGGYSVSRYAPDGHSPCDALTQHTTLGDARAAVMALRRRCRFEDMDLSALRWGGYQGEGDLEAYHDFPEGHEQADGCGGYVIRRCARS